MEGKLPRSKIIGLQRWTCAVYSVSSVNMLCIIILVLKQWIVHMNASSKYSNWRSVFCNPSFDKTHNERLITKHRKTVIIFTVYI